MDDHSPARITSFEQAEMLTAQMRDDFDKLEIASSIGELGWAGFGADMWEIAQLDPGVALQISECLLVNARLHHRTGLLCNDSSNLALFVGLRARGMSLGAKSTQSQTPLVPAGFMRPIASQHFKLHESEVDFVHILSSHHVFNGFQRNARNELHSINPPHPKTMSPREHLDFASIQLLGYWSKRDINSLDKPIDPQIFSSVPLPEHLCGNPAEFDEVARAINLAHLGLIHNYEEFKSQRTTPSRRL